MVEAVRTTQSTFGIWVIVAVAMISLAAWLVGVYIVDNYQTRLSRQRRGLDGPGPVLGAAGGPSAASVPGQRRDAGQPEPAPEQPAPEPARESVAARGRHARPAEYYAAADYYGTADYKAAERPPAGYPEVRPRGVEEAEAARQADAPTRPDLPAQPTQADIPAQAGEPTQAEGPAEAAPTGRHAMPTQRSGDSDRAERSSVSPDADREDDQDQR
jgi:hypothetical protein